MLQQYYAAKAEHPDVLLAMRVGDFYEFYGEDAETAAKALEITLTGREDGSNGRIPMAGVPFHSVEKYLARLIQSGYKVALCDQLEDPKQAKGLVKRGVTRVLTAGTVLEDSMLDGAQNNFLAAICVLEGQVGLATLDPSTGEFAVTEVVGEELQDRILQELARIRPSELLVGPKAEGFGEIARQGLGALVTDAKPLTLERAARLLREKLEVANLEGFGCEDKPSAVVAASMILAYAEKNGLALGHIDTLSTYSVDGFMRLDGATRRSLELTQNMAEGGKLNSLLWVLDRTCTRMGARLLRKWIEQPLLDTATIRSRLDGVERFLTSSLIRGDFRESLSKIQDIERLVARCSAGLAGPRDLAALRQTLQTLPALEPTLAKLSVGRIEELRRKIQDHEDLGLLLVRALAAEPPHSAREGGIIRSGYDEELDKLRDLTRNGRKFIAELEAKERASTGIANLKVGFNAVFGYYLEIPKTQLEKVPEGFIRKQTTANAERYITAELKEHESLVLGAEEKAAALEADLFHRLRARVAGQAPSLLETARALAELDVLASLAEVASVRRYCKPEIRTDGRLEIVGGRHPVVEAGGASFVPNDLYLAGSRDDVESQDGPQGPRTIILTGPNMSGKSTYLRQTALIVLMAQIGSYVPAETCHLGLCDRIFARIGAKDELALGQSTFMVEMLESANILNHAGPSSLVILDEVGRGTSTYDGMAIAWAMIERLAEIGCKTMFATHYHQLNALAEQIAGVANFRVSVEEFGDEIVWTHKVLPGGTDRSYGIHVAKMAGMPGSVLNRAEEILSELESTSRPTPAPSAKLERLQLTLFEAERPEVLGELEKVDLNQMTPMQALHLLAEWQQRFAPGPEPDRTL
jgi:DNA mismatch repair protein MutS